MELRKRKLTRDKVRETLSFWHQFPFEYWWRKKYNIPFGSPQHRQMNLFDMLLEYQEEMDIINETYKSEYDEELTGGEPMTQNEIDDDYENLDINNLNL